MEEKENTKKATRKRATKKKVLPQAKKHSNSIDLPETSAALIFNEDGAVNVYISSSQENEETSGVYAPHEELCIAIAGMLQNQAYVENTLKIFRELFETAILKNNHPKDGID